MAPTAKTNKGDKSAATAKKAEPTKAAAAPAKGKVEKPKAEATKPAAAAKNVAAKEVKAAAKDVKAAPVKKDVKAAAPAKKDAKAAAPAKEAPKKDVKAAAKPAAAPAKKVEAAKTDKPAEEKPHKAVVAKPAAAKPKKSVTAAAAAATGKVGKKAVLRGKGLKKKKVSLRYAIDCTNIAEDNILDVVDFEKYIKARMKVNDKVNNLGNNVTFERVKMKLYVNSDVHFSKAYLKYLTKKYLKKNSLRDWIRVVANDKDSYELRYFRINSNDDEDEDAE
ncbi:large ribosomal subunit protein eL22 [Musca vetustissima]|uniref:large ribosomal subunit protein eL22 n=2 Tax=Musca vetustissima TaxID=27455 RepID=UPI002AB6FC46|nr:large ribosomal subunit protein eL22 [Musca vetustissima]